MALGCRRVELRLRVKGAADVQKRLAERSRQLFCKWRQHHSATNWHEQFVAQLLAQPGECSAHRGLTKVETETGPRYAPLAE